MYRLLRVIESAYEAALKPSLLPSLLDALSEYLESPGAQLVVAGIDGCKMRAVARTESAGAWPFAASWNASIARVLESLQIGRPFLFRDYPELFANRASPAPVTDPAWMGARGAVVGRQDGETLLLVVPEPQRSKRSEEDWRVALDAVLPHLVRAFRLAQRAEGHALGMHAAAALIRRLPMPSLLTDAAGRCLERNDAAHRILAHIRMELLGGRLRFEDPFLQSSWESALFEASTTAVTRSMLASSAQGRHWKLHLVPFQCLVGDDASTPQGMLLVMFEEDGARQDALPDSLLAVTKLTPAEIEVLSGLLHGYTAKVIAKTRGASVNTVRSQIMAILAKTGHRSQKELIAAFGASSFKPSASDPYA